jgi:transposase
LARRQGLASARDLSARPGLLPRQTTTGGKGRPSGITKRGNVHLRAPLIRDARAALPGSAASRRRSALGCVGCSRSAHPNLVVLALAAKLARIAWAVLRGAADYDARAARA